MYKIRTEKQFSVLNRHQRSPATDSGPLQRPPKTGQEVGPAFSLEIQEKDAANRPPKPKT